VIARVVIACVVGDIGILHAACVRRGRRIGFGRDHCTLRLGPAFHAAIAPRNRVRDVRLEERREAECRTHDDRRIIAPRFMEGRCMRPGNVA